MLKLYSLHTSAVRIGLMSQPRHHVVTASADRDKLIVKAKVEVVAIFLFIQVNTLSPK